MASCVCHESDIAWLRCQIHRPISTESRRTGSDDRRKGQLDDAYYAWREGRPRQRAPTDRRAAVGYVVLEHHEKYDRPRVAQQYGTATLGPAPHLMDREVAEHWCACCNEAEADNPRGYRYTVAACG
jgi:hypothetical protein